MTNNLFEQAGIPLPEMDEDSNKNTEKNTESKNENKNKSKKKKKDSQNSVNSCGASSSAAGSNVASDTKSKEPDNDLSRLVYLGNEGQRLEFNKNYTLEEMRQEIEQDYPAYTHQNTYWWVEKQEEKERYLCMATYKANKAG